MPPPISSATPLSAPTHNPNAFSDSSKPTAGPPPFTRGGAPGTSVRGDRSIGWLRQHVGGPLHHAAQGARQMTRIFGHRSGHGGAIDPAQTDVTGPGPEYIQGTPLPPIFTLHVGDLPVRYPPPSFYRCGWSRNGENMTPLYVEAPPNYTPQPLPIGLSSASASTPRDPLITHF